MISPVKIWRNQKNIIDIVGKVGTVVSYTIVRVPASGFSDQAPYPVALIKLPSGIKITAQLVDQPDLTIHTGDRVRLIIRRIREPGEDGIIPYGIKAIRIGGKHE